MKTKEQILEWLDKQPWKNEFYENYFKYNECQMNFNENLIDTAFTWEETKEGVKFWMKQDVKYQEWYDSNDKPMSWEEYCKRNQMKESDYFIDAFSSIISMKDCIKGKRNSKRDANVMSKELCEAFVAYMKLIQLRNAWVKDYKCYNNDIRYRIISQNGDIVVIDMLYGSRGLSFAYDKEAQEFLDTFKDLLETAKPLL